MFTLKFCQFFGEGGHLEDCIRCPHYTAYKTSDGAWMITAYGDFCNVEGVERRVCADPKDGGPNTYYSCCYVENESGKTIGHYTYDKRSLDSKSHYETLAISEQFHESDL